MEVKTIAVIGAGTMGRGIAYAAALGGFQTVLEDVSEVALDKAIAWIHEAIRRGCQTRQGGVRGKRCGGCENYDFGRGDPCDSGRGSRH
jgi:3-hydroxyacyl-CoA dehydrogenase